MHKQRPQKAYDSLAYAYSTCSVHLRNTEATHRLIEVHLQFLSGFRDVCLLTFPQTSAVINQSTHISAWQHRKQDCKKKKPRKKKGKGCKSKRRLPCSTVTDELFWQMAQPRHWSNKNKNTAVKNTGTLFWWTHASSVCLYLPLQKYKLFAFCFCSNFYLIFYVFSL